MDKHTKTINSRIGPLVISTDKTIRFPRGLIGFEHLRDFALIEFKPDTPFHFLQSLETPSMGMMLADPFSFLPNYEIKLSSTEERILQIDAIRNLIILVSMTVPKGNPENSTLNLTGPICVNANKRIGLQSPQVETSFPTQILLRETCGTGNDHGV